MMPLNTNNLDSDLSISTEKIESSGELESVSSLTSAEISKLMELANLYMDPTEISELFFKINSNPINSSEIKSQSLIIYDLYKSIIDADQNIVARSYTEEILNKASNNYNYASLLEDKEDNHDFYMELLHHDLGSVESVQKQTNKKLAVFFGNTAVDEVRGEVENDNLKETKFN